MKDNKDPSNAPTLPNQQAQKPDFARGGQRTVTNLELLESIERVHSAQAETRKDIGDLRREMRDTRNELSEVRIEQRAQRTTLEDHAAKFRELDRDQRGGRRYRGKLPSLTSETAGDLDGALSSDDRLQRAEAEIIRAKAAWWKQAAAVVAIIVPVLAAGLGILDRIVTSRLEHVQDAAKSGAAEAVREAPLQKTGTDP